MIKKYKNEYVFFLSTGDMYLFSFFFCRLRPFLKSLSAPSIEQIIRRRLIFRKETYQGRFILINFLDLCKDFQPFRFR